MLSKDGPKYLDICNMINFINYLYKKDNNKIFKFYLNSNYQYNEFSGIPDNNNIIFNFLFLVNNITNLKNKLINLNINEGPQK
jgi:hypothetical protein